MTEWTFEWDHYAGVDYETFSDVELSGPEAKGLPNYVASPNFRPLIVCTSGGDAPAWFDFVMQDAWVGFDYLQHYDPDGEDYIDYTIEEAWRHRLDYEVEVGHKLVAHNAGFERAVTKHMFPDYDPFMFVDSAVTARLLGADGSLAMASRQLNVAEKMEVGADLIQLFCVPNEFYPMGPTRELIMQHGHLEKWKLFREYCLVDADAGQEIQELGHKILDEFHPGLMEREILFEQATWEMNQAGWKVDVELVKKMKQRSWANGIIAERLFQVEDESGNRVMINFASHPQLKAFCEKRGVRYKSLDKYHLPGVLQGVKDRIAKLEDKDNSPQIVKAIGMLKEVEMLLETKAEIGGSTLSKLPTMLNLVSDDGILRDQYVHFGAGQTGRSTARGVQLQNLKKLTTDGGEIKDVSSIYDFQTHWSNGDMAGQLRQVLTSRHPDGEVLVGDFAGVESRGLAYSAGEEWKLQAFRDGLDVYCVLVTRFIPGLEYEEVADKTGEMYLKLRPRGKYSELSCGYQASGKAVMDFMFRLGFVVTLDAATENVTDWRRACPATVEYWEVLDTAMKAAVRLNKVVEEKIGNGLSIRITPFGMPSVQAQHPGALSLCVQMLLPDGSPFVTRFVHGCYFRRTEDRLQLCYYKPAERLSEGQLWRAVNQDMSAKRSKELGRQVVVYYSIYGGKLAGIFTQSMCREIFFDSLTELRRLFKSHGVTNAAICGQFHDEINVDWWPGEYDKQFIRDLMDQAMSNTILQDFPLDVEVHSAFRYIK